MARKKSGKNASTPGQIHTPIEIDSDDEDAAPHSAVHRHNTRTAKNGRAADTYEKYDMRYHPADDTLRPAQAAKRHASHPFSRSISVSTISKEDEEQTDEESLPPSAGDNTSTEDSEQDSSHEIIPSKRKPDPKASRSSKRAEARKFHNYSKKHHKDDEHIPGFEHKADKLKRVAAVDVSEETAPKRPRLGRLRKSQPPPVTPRSQNSIDVDELVEETLLTLEEIPPLTARVSTNDDHADSVSSSGEDDEPVTPLQTANVGVEDDPLPLFTNIENEADEHALQSDSSMQAKIPNETSDGIDEALLRFAEVPTSDGNVPADVATSDESTSRAQHSEDIIEAVQDVSDASHADSSHTLNDSINLEEGEDGHATSSMSPGAVTKTVDDVADDKVGPCQGPHQIAILREDTQKSDDHGVQSIHSGQYNDKDVSDDRINAVLSTGSMKQTASGNIDTQHETGSTEMSKTSESSKTLTGDYVAEDNGAAEGDSIPGNGQLPDFEDTEGSRQTQQVERVSAVGSEGPNEELVQAAVTTLQAMLENDIATSQQVVANSSSSGMLM